MIRRHEYPWCGRLGCNRPRAARSRYCSPCRRVRALKFWTTVAFLTLAVVGLSLAASAATGRSQGVLPWLENHRWIVGPAAVAFLVIVVLDTYRICRRRPGDDR